MQNGCVLEKNKNITATWQTITKNVEAIRANKNIPKIYRTAVKHLYAKYYKQFFGEDVQLGSTALPIALTQVPAWIALTSQERSAILSDPQQTNALIKTLTDVYLKSQHIAQFLSIAPTSLVYPITFDLVDAVTNNHIDCSVLLDKIVALSTVVPKEDRKKFLSLFTRNIAQPSDAAKTKTQLAQENSKQLYTTYNALKNATIQRLLNSIKIWLIYRRFQTNCTIYSY